MLRDLLGSVKDERRDQAKQYSQGDILFFSVLGILSGATSYRKLEIFMEERYEYLKERFSLKWKRAPSYGTIRNIIHNVSPKALELVFRKHAEVLSEKGGKTLRVVSLDGKTLRGSFDHFEDQKAIQVFSAFLLGENLILAHEEIEGQKTNEIPVAQELIENLGLHGVVFTGDAMHCQKKPSRS